MGVSAIFGCNRYLVPFTWGVATPGCGLVRNDSKNVQTPIYRCLHRIAPKGVQTIQRVKNALPFREGIVGNRHCGLNS